MSHISLLQTEIQENVDKDLLIEAVKLTAEELNGEITSFVSDRYGRYYKSYRGTKILIAIKTKEVPYGVGIGLEGKKLVFIGDDEDLSEFERICDLIKRKYLELAVLIALKKRGYSIKTRKIEEGTQIIAKLRWVLCLWQGDKLKE